MEYEGSVAICPSLIEAAGLFSYEQVDVYNLDNGERLTTYVISGEKGEICLNGAAAHKGKAGQKVIIAAYTCMEEAEIPVHSPKLVFVDDNNLLVSTPRG